MPASLPAVAPPRRGRLDLVVAWVCAAVALVFTSAELATYLVGFVDQARLVAALVGTVLLPGALISRRFPTPDLPSRLGVAFVSGIGAQFLGWALGVAIHGPWLLWVIPLAFGLLCAAPGFLRDRRRSPAERTARLSRHAQRPTPWWASIVLLATWLLMLRSIDFGLWRITPLSDNMRWYQDMYWHLSITADAMHHVPPTDPQSAADGTLSYHWFSNAHAAALSMTSGVGVDKVAIVAWVVPIMAATLGLVHGFTRYLARSHVAAALAVGLLVLPPNTIILHSLDTGATSGLVWLSPSHIFSLPVAVAATWAIVALLRQRRPALHEWAFVFYLALLCPGTKVSLLPTLLGGLGFVALLRLPRRRGLARPLLMAATGAVIVVATSSLFAGGGGGSRPQFGATADQTKIWHRTVEAIGTPGTPTLILVLIALLGTFIGYLCVETLFRDREDPAPRLFTGMMLVAFIAMFGLQHPSLSQVYFMRGIMAVAACFLAWGVIAVGQAAVDTFGRQRTRNVMVVTFLAALGLGWLWQNTVAFTRPERLDDRWLAPLAMLIVVFAVLLVVAQRSTRPWAKAVTLVVTVGTLGYSLTFSALGTSQDPKPQAHSRGAPRPVIVSPGLTDDEKNGAAALAAANPDGKLIATNVHCLLTVTQPHCDARGFWVAAVTRSPVDIGGWGYSNSARVLDGQGHLPYTRQPYPHHRAFALNEKVFADPTPADLAALRARGVRFLYADTRASRVSPTLLKLAPVIWKSKTVTVLSVPTGRA